jgi:hypothetical protein
MAADSPCAWKTAFDGRTDLLPYGDNALGLFALALRFRLDDLVSIAADALTDGHDDKKCDLIHIDTDEGYAVVAQCYIAKKTKQSAKANKASDLNTAVAWLLQRPIEDLPKQLSSPATELRSAIEDGTISLIHFWFVHNLPESPNVHQELLSVEETAKAALHRAFKEKSVAVQALEVGQGLLEEWYQGTQSPILVTDEFQIDSPSGFEVSGPDWRSYVSAIPAVFLHKLYKKYKTKLFSANVRDYLGSRSSDSNSNKGIKRTAENDGNNFWVYNNGLTVLVNEFSSLQYGKLIVKGMSIVNGAQTTGAIGALNKAPMAEVMVPARFVQTTNPQLILDIIRYNNSQNKVTASDFRSTDNIQKRLREQIQRIPDARYEGGRRGSHSDAIQRPANLMPSYTVGQALAALHGDALVAYNRKANIWVDDRLYGKYFNDETRATHLVFAYSLLRAVESKKYELVSQHKRGDGSLTSSESGQLDFFRKRGAIYLFVSAVSSCLEIFLRRKIPNLFRLSFGEKVSPRDGEKIWSNVVDTILPLCIHLDEAISDGLKSAERVKKSIQKFQSLVEVTATSNRTIYSGFAQKIIGK